MSLWDPTHRKVRDGWGTRVLVLGEEEPLVLGEEEPLVLDEEGTLVLDEGTTTSEGIEVT